MQRVMDTTLLSEIEAFCEHHGMSVGRFGELALNDKPFVYQLREGRRVWPETGSKVRDFMASYKPESEAA